MVKKESLFNIRNCVLVCLSHAKIIISFLFKYLYFYSWDNLELNPIYESMSKFVKF